MTQIETDVYGTLRRIVEAYDQAMNTMFAMTEEIEQMRQEIADLRNFVNSSHADALTGRNVWRQAAEAHKANVALLEQQLIELRGK